MKQGEIWYASLDPIQGSEQAGYRPVIIVSGNLMNEFAPVLICCPLSTKLKHYKGNLILEPNTTNGLKKTSEVMTIHIRSISKSRLKGKIGNISHEGVELVKQTINELLSY